MSGFLIFVEGVKAPVTRAQLESWGLAHAFVGVPNHTQGVGPGGVSGVLLANVAALEPFQPVYLPEEQVWSKAPGFAAPVKPWHLGYYKAARPSADDLARSNQVPGDVVELGDGAWRVPRVYTTRPDGVSYPALPCYFELADDGKRKRGPVVDELAWLLERVTPFWNAWLEGYEQSSEEEDTFTITLPDSIFTDAAAVLSANYHVGPVECEALRLFRSDDGGLAAVMGAACDTASAIAFLKKKPPSPPVKSSRGRGSRGGSKATSQA